MNNFKNRIRLNSTEDEIVNYYDKNSYKYYSELGKMVEELENLEEGLSIQYLEFLYKSFEKYLNRL